MIKIDLHTHSSDSPDGGIRPDQYANVLKNGGLNCIAVTDHDTVDAALSLHKAFGHKIIIGQEITTSEGELVGLFLKKAVAPRQSALATAQAIKKQGGLVYVPHPLETIRAGVSNETLDKIVRDVDIIEAHNGRAVFQNRGPQATAWARLNGKVVAASSDAHGYKGLLATYTEIDSMPTKDNLVSLLKTARLHTKRPPLKTLFYPKINRLRKKVKR